jgi:uncharacterized membrane protein
VEVSPKSVWTAFTVAIVLVAAVLLLFWSEHPPVGVYIAILALLGAGVPLIRKDISTEERALWTGLMLILMVLEITSIYKEQHKHDQEEAAARALELNGFRSIAEGI